MKKYVLTGAPGTGKSTVMLLLEASGEYIIREAAEDYIKLRQAQGQKEPWKEPDFQEKILELQILRESRIPKNIERIFIDRGTPDGLAYAKDGTETYRIIEEAARKSDYSRIFMIGQLWETEKNSTRRESTEEAGKLGEIIGQIYRKLGYKPVKVEAGNAAARATEILAKIKEDEENGN